jgi:hypothetical protein
MGGKAGENTPSQNLGLTGLPMAPDCTDTDIHNDFPHFPGENKVTISKTLNEIEPNLLEFFEDWCNNPSYTKREVGFCARWCLDNLCKYT